MEKSRRTIREPVQNRSRRLKKRILETAIRIFSEKGYYHTSSSEISKASGVSVGSFYSYFKDKKQLFIEVMNYFDELIDREIDIEGTIITSNGEEFLGSLIRKLLSAHKIYPGFHKELAAMRILDPDIGKFYDQIEQRAVDSCYRSLRQWKDRLKITNLRAASVIVYKTIDAIIHEIISKDNKKNEEILISELIGMLSGYLL